MLLQYFGYIFLAFGLFQPLYWLYRPEIARCIFLGFGLYDGIGSLYVTREKPIWLFLAKNFFQVVRTKKLCCYNILAIFFLVFGLFQPLHWLYRLEIARCIFLGFGLYGGISSLCVTRENKIWLFLAKNRCQSLAYFRQLFQRNRLDIARCKTTGSGRPYGVGRVVVVCNAQEELWEQY